MATTSMLDVKLVFQETDRLGNDLELSYETNKVSVTREYMPMSNYESSIREDGSRSLHQIIGDEEIKLSFVVANSNAFDTFLTDIKNRKTLLRVLYSGYLMDDYLDPTKRNQYTYTITDAYVNKGSGRKEASYEGNIVDISYDLVGKIIRTEKNGEEVSIPV